MKTGAYYVAQAKRKAGDALMSDRELAHRFGCSNSLIAQARTGYMTDPFALRLADYLGEHPGEVLMVARLERERDVRVKRALQSYAAKIFASASRKGAAMVLIAASTLGLAAHHDLGGEGALRPT